MAETRERIDLRNVMFFEAGMSHIAAIVKEYINERLHEDAPAIKSETHDALMDIHRLVNEEVHE